MIKQIFIALVLMVCTMQQVFAKQDIQRPESYNYLRGVEAVNNNQLDEGLDFLNKEIEENPENGYAFAWIASVRAYKKEYGRALTAVNLSIKYLPKKDKTYKAFAYTLRADINIGLGEKDRAIMDYTEALKYTPEDEDLYEKRAQIYYEQGKYDLADADYNKIISINEGSIYGYMGLGRNDDARKDYENAIAHYDYVIKLASDYSSGYSFRAESYMALHHYNEAIEDIIKALEIDYDNRAFYLLQNVADSAFNELEARMKIQCNKRGSDGYWSYCLGAIYERTKQYKAAIEQYKNSFDKDKSPVTTYRIACCYEELGDYESALSNIDISIGIDSIDSDYMLERADLLYELGKTKDAISQLDKYIEANPEFYGGYYRRGFYKDNTADYDGAINDYSMSISLEPTYAYAYLGRADMYKAKGEKELSIADYKKVIELDSIPGNSSCAQYAYMELGENENAIDFMNRIIESDKTDAGNYYDAACLYARMRRLETSIEMLRKSLDLGFRRFKHIENDDDLNALRTMPEFNELIKIYKERHSNEVADKSDNDFIETIVEVPFTNENNICKVKCSINNLPLHFVFDTGASDIHISNVEATFMLKNGYLSQQDFQGKQNYITADGDISEGTIINLRNVEFGGIKLSNIKASVVKNQKAPLLLGQSVLKKLGRIEIDNDREILRITYKEPK